MNRRAVLGGLGGLGLTALAGCLGTLGMDVHESSPAGVDASVRSETGYDQTDVEPLTVEEDVGVGAASETIAVTNYLTEHEKAVDMGPLGRQRGAVFMVLTTPQIGAAGRNFNPVEEMDAEELVALVEDNYDDISDITNEETADITILEQTTTRSRFSADATFDGHSLEVDLHVSEAVEAGDDLLVTIGVYPQQVRSVEQSNILELMEGVTTDIELDDTASSDDGGDEDADEDGETDGGDEDADEDGETDGDDEDDGDETNDSDDDDGLLGTLE
ncbi:DUF6517 family protein [Natronorubrum bangense]|uniref:Uncharacterized protein n=2 Tax=Natronorubrum bangense TaxID=61858 RepID=A0A4D6HSY8_9EURY|nr:DUF6517 family protein [Natronorubrum bangense]ELY43161.1 hypothetical protein C494_19227 [Natronorubrum bangense JCM 10635]QCC53260.1 hypothetical protein DV706_01415 [Natronorubrum bangense]QCC56047.1 hypothetical protein DV706_15855 [Natronorubrum bangense]